MGQVAPGRWWQVWPASALYWGDVRNSWEPRSGSGALGERPRQPYAEIVRGALAARIERILMDTWIHGNLLIPLQALHSRIVMTLENSRCSSMLCTIPFPAVLQLTYMVTLPTGRSR